MLQSRWPAHVEGWRSVMMVVVMMQVVMVLIVAIIATG
jgi:preprotein translocase subunit SecE